MVFQEIICRSGEKFIKAVCELGGSAPGIVFQDAELDIAIGNIYSNRFANAGQMCDALKRLLIHSSIADEVISRLVKRLSPIEVGDPLKDSTEFGPLVAERQVKLLEEQVQDAVTKGAKVIVGGKRPDGITGAYYLPTLLTQVTPDMRVWQEEVFGPVLPIMTFETDDQAVALANDTKYGLGAYIYSYDVSHAQAIASQIASGMVSINGASYVHPGSPFGGYKDSGMGREHGKFGFSDITQIKIIAHKK